MRIEVAHSARSEVSARESDSSREPARVIEPYRASREHGSCAVKTVEILVPAYNEEENIGVLIEHVFSRLNDPRYRFEMIVVDDGSEDRTSEVVKAYLDRYPVTLVTLAENFGKEAAILAGLDHSAGAATIIMDADLQNPLSVVPRFLELWEQGYDCAYGVKANRHDEPLIKRIAIKLFYAVLNKGSDVRIPPDAQDFRLLDHAVVQALRSLRERVRFTKGLYAWVGFRSVGVPFTMERRRSGDSKFGWARLCRLGWDGLTSFSDFPLAVAVLVGLLVACLSIIYAIVVAVGTVMFGADVPGWATLAVAIAGLGGFQLFLLGVVGHYLRKIYLEAKGRPEYVVRALITSGCSARGSAALDLRSEMPRPHQNGDDASSGASVHPHGLLAPHADRR